MTRPLEHIRVLDFTTTIAGPYCARLLADLGATVIKVEAAEGDLMRSRPPMRDGASTSFGQLNAGKRSIVLDLKQPAAQDIVRRLLADDRRAGGEFPARRDAPLRPRLRRPRRNPIRR